MLIADVDAETAATEARIRSLRAKLVESRWKRVILTPLRTLPSELIPRILNRVVGTKAEIQSLKAKLAELERKRNMLTPLCNLPSELIMRILKLIVDDASCTIRERADTGQNISIETFPWKSATQICAHWRALALGFPALWTFVVTANWRWFTLFIERSQDQLLDVDTWTGGAKSYVEDWMFRIVVENLHRVRSLCVRCGHNSHTCLYLMQHVPAPELEVLQYVAIGRTLDSVVLSDPYHSQNTGPMPKLRSLHIDIRSVHLRTFHEKELFPLGLSTVTTLVLKGLCSREQLDILNRCRRVHRLTITGDDRHAPIGGTAPISLPNLRHLDVTLSSKLLLSTHTLSYLQFPSLSQFEGRMEVPPDPVKGGDLALQVMTRIFNTFNNPMRSENEKIYVIAICFAANRFRITAQTKRHTSLAKIRIGIPHRYEPPGDNTGYLHFFKGLRRLAETMEARIDSIHVVHGPLCPNGLQALLFPLQDHPHLTRIVINDSHALANFLSFSNPACMQGFCKCEQCRELRLVSFPGLSTISLNNIHEELVMNYKGTNWLKMFLDWVEERNSRGLVLQKVFFKIVRTKSKAGQKVLDKLPLAVKSVRVEEITGVAH